MTERTYKLRRPVAGFEADAVLDVTARFGGWHRYDVKLEPHADAGTGSVELTDHQLEVVADPVTPSA